MNKDFDNKILIIKDLKVKFDTLSYDKKTGEQKKVFALNGINLDLNKGEVLGIVGESGSGKSQAALSIMGLLAKNAHVSGEIYYLNKDLLKIDKKDLNKIRGMTISMIFQDSMTSLNPYLRVSTQLMEILIERGESKEVARKRAIDVLNTLGFANTEKIIDNYPHQFSGGMRQRIMIAMSLITDAEIIIADEPTTALDVTTQAQILEIIYNLKTEMNKSIIFITHDLAVISKIADKIAVFYAGEIVEYGTKEEIFFSPKHPYTEALLKCVPNINDLKKDLFLISGKPPLLTRKPTSCSFQDRCSYAMSICSKQLPKTYNISSTHQVSCFKYESREK